MVGRLRFCYVVWSVIDSSLLGAPPGLCRVCFLVMMVLSLLKSLVEQFHESWHWVVDLDIDDPLGAIGIRCKIQGYLCRWCTS